MKTEIIKATSTEQFPALYELNSGNGLVVLFTDLRTGCVMVQGSGPHRIGHTSEDWAQCDAPMWTRMPVGTKIVLEQTA